MNVKTATFVSTTAPIPIPISNTKSKLNSSSVDYDDNYDSDYDYNISYDSPKKEQSNKKQTFEYNLNSNIFDPSKSPPISEFMTKLNFRMKNYGWDWTNNSDNFEKA